MSKEKTETIVEDKEHNWIERYKDEDDEWYSVYLSENCVCVSMSPEGFEALRKLFQKLEDSNPI